jgi:hypothetical protein
MFAACAQHVFRNGFRTSFSTKDTAIPSADAAPPFCTRCSLGRTVGFSGSANRNNPGFRDTRIVIVGSDEITTDGWLFHDAEADQVLGKEYKLFEWNGTRVTGHADEYEPESIWIHFEGGPVGQARLDELFERADCQLLRLEKAANTARVAKSSLRSDQPVG